MKQETARFDNTKRMERILADTTACPKCGAHVNFFSPETLCNDCLAEEADPVVKLLAVYESKPLGSGERIQAFREVLKAVHEEQL